VLLYDPCSDHIPDLLHPLGESFFLAHDKPVLYKLSICSHGGLVKSGPYGHAILFISFGRGEERLDVASLMQGHLHFSRLVGRPLLLGF